MLKHDETQDLPAASQRVTAEELSRAVSALDEARAAEQIYGTAPIGQVVEELGLDATPEEIWAQVQQQRAADMAKTAAVALVKTARVSPAARRRVRGWHEIKGWVWIAFWCFGGVGLVSHWVHPGGPPAGMVIKGDAQTVTSATAGKSVEVSGDGDTLTLTGDCPVLTISGDGNHIRVQGKVGRVVADGDSNTITYTSSPAPVLSGDGDGNTVGPPSPQ